MLQEVPDHRENYKKLLDHAVFMGNKARLQIVSSVAEKSKQNDINEILKDIMNKNEVHMEGFRGTETDEWLEFLAANSNCRLLDIKSCSILVMKLHTNNVLDSLFVDSLNSL